MTLGWFYLNCYNDNSVVAVSMRNFKQVENEN